MPEPQVRELPEAVVWVVALVQVRVPLPLPLQEQARAQTQPERVHHMKNRTLCRVLPGHRSFYKTCVTSLYVEFPFTYFDYIWGDMTKL